MKAYELKGWNVASLGNTVQCADSGLGVDGEGCNIKGHMQVNKVRMCPLVVCARTRVCV